MKTLFALVCLAFCASSAPAQQYITGGTYDQCVTSFYDPDMYHWLSFRNQCQEPISVTFCWKASTQGCGTVELQPGRHKSTGFSRSEIDSKGGYAGYVCPLGYLPVDAGDNYVRGERQYRCKKSRYD